jgi:hypothetical protein
MDDHLPDWLLEAFRRDKSGASLDDLVLQLRAAAARANVRVDQLRCENGKVGLPGVRRIAVPVSAVGTVRAVFAALEEATRRFEDETGRRARQREQSELRRARLEQTRAHQKHRL